MWKLGIVLLIPAVFGKLQQQEKSLEGCLLPDGRFFAVGEKWDIKTGGVSCGAYCTCQGINAFGCVGCPLVQERPPVAPPPKFQNKILLRREKREKSQEGCLLPDGRFFAVGEKWDIKTGGVSCGAYCTCQGINAFGCVGCPLVQERPPVALPLEFQERTLRREKRETEMESQCKYNGKTYNQGDSFLSADGCKTCFCVGEEMVACMRGASCPQGCSWNGSIFGVGETFYNGCAVCMCKPNNKINCRVDSCLPTLGQQESQREQSTEIPQSLDDIQSKPDIPAL